MSIEPEDFDAANMWCIHLKSDEGGRLKHPFFATCTLTINDNNLYLRFNCEHTGPLPGSPERPQRPVWRSPVAIKTPEFRSYCRNSGISGITAPASQFWQYSDTKMMMMMKKKQDDDGDVIDDHDGGWC